MIPLSGRRDGACRCDSPNSYSCNFVHSVRIGAPRLRATRRVLKTMLGIVSIVFLCGFNFVSEIKNEKGNDYYKKGELGRARTQYQDALKSNPAETAASYNLGNTFYKEDKYESAQSAYEKAAKNEKDAPAKARAYYNLGNSYVRLKQNDKAIEAYENALRLNPRDQDAKYNLELLTKKDEKKDDKKDQQKKDDKKDQPKDQNQKDKQDQGGQGQQDKQDQGGQGQKDQQDQGGGQGQQNQDKSEEKKDEPNWKKWWELFF